MNWIEHTNVIERIERRLDKLEQDGNNLGALIEALNKMIESQEKINRTLERLDDTIYYLKKAVEESC